MSGVNTRLRDKTGAYIDGSNPLPVSSTPSGTQDVNIAQVLGSAVGPANRVPVESIPSLASDTESTALANSIVIKGSAGTLYELVVTNTNASAQLIQLHDAIALPANTTVPVKSFYVGANQSVSYTPVGGIAFSTGIVAANSSTAATLTVGGADCWFDARYV